MIQLTKDEEKLRDKLKKQVDKYYPKSYAKQVTLGRHTIEYLNEDYETIDILATQYFIPTLTVIEAWQLAANVCKTTQNINRTHPIKVELSDSEGKYERVRNRRNKNIKK
jgi:phage tail protein X